MESKEIFDLIIIGAGPAGLTSAIYAGRANLNILVIEKEGIGSLLMAHKIDNYPGFSDGITGKELYEKMKKQALKYGVNFRKSTLLGIVTDLGKTATYLVEEIRKAKAEK